jgi:hypothetical protein
MVCPFIAIVISLSPAVPLNAPEVIASPPIPPFAAPALPLPDTVRVKVMTAGTVPS